MSFNNLASVYIYNAARIELQRKIVKNTQNETSISRGKYSCSSVRGINTRWENCSDALYQTIIPLLREVVKNTPKNVGIFCASYDVLEGLLKNGFDRMVKSLGKTCFSEKFSMSAGDNDILIEQYKSKSTEAGGVLLGACGGRNSEGEDFPGDFMNAVVVVGVPFQRSYSFFKCKN